MISSNFRYFVEIRIWALGIIDDSVVSKNISEIEFSNNLFFNSKGGVIFKDSLAC